MITYGVGSSVYDIIMILDYDIARKQSYYDPRPAIRAGVAEESRKLKYSIDIMTFVFLQTLSLLINVTTLV